MPGSVIKVGQIWFLILAGKADSETFRITKISDSKAYHGSHGYESLFAHLDASGCSKTDRHHRCWHWRWDPTFVCECGILRKDCLCL